MEIVNYLSIKQVDKGMSEGLKIWGRVEIGVNNLPPFPPGWNRVLTDLPESGGGDVQPPLPPTLFRHTW